jgi:hypothetical protein
MIDQLIKKTSDLLEQLAASRVSLLCVLLVANALTQPYAGFHHDSRLYAVQIEERNHPGAYAQDLYLRYGSQDRFSLFTSLAAPIAAVLGLEAAFFILYLASKVLFLWGALRLIQTLIPDRRAAVVSLLYISIVRLPFGGNEIFHINESFLTPRIAACGLVFLGMEKMLTGRLKIAVLLLSGAMLLHPLMAVGGVLVFALWWSATHLNRCQLAGLLLAGCALAAVVMGYEPLGERLFGRIDQEWRSVLVDVCYFIDPSWWRVSDWIRIVWSFGIVGAACATFARSWSSLLLAILGTAVVGLAGTFVAVHSPYLLLYQTSPYRAMWLLEFLAIPLAFQGAVTLWERGTGTARLLGLALVLLASCDWGNEPIPALGLLLLVLPACVVGYRGLSASPNQPDWLERSTVCSGAVLGLILCAYTVWLLVVLHGLPSSLDVDIHLLLMLRNVGILFYKVVLLVGIVGGTCALLAVFGSPRRLQIGCLVLGLGYQGLLFAASQARWYDEHCSVAGRPCEFVAGVVQEHSAALGRPLTVYWPQDLRRVWFTARANSYFNTVQLSGCGFNRGTALEGKRRALLVRRFELDRLHRNSNMLPCWQAAMQSFFEEKPSEPGPTAEDLLRLCREEGLDYVILAKNFEGIPSETDGSYFIYDCRQVRALALSQGVGSPAHGAASTTSWPIQTGQECLQGGACHCQSMQGL